MKFPTNATVLNVVIKWVALMLYVQDALGSNLGRELGYNDWGFMWLSSALQKSVEIIPKKIQFLAGHEINCFYGIRLNKNSSVGSILSQLNRVYTFTTYFFKVNFTIIIQSMPMSPELSLPFHCSHQNFWLINFEFFWCMQQAQPIASFLT